jgi:arginase family enzyme
MIRQETSLPHTGIATFCKAAYVPDLSQLDADVGVVGVPTDFATSMRPGCRAYSDRSRSAFRTDGDRDSNLMAITIPK